MEFHLLKTRIALYHSGDPHHLLAKSLYLRHNKWIFLQPASAHAIDMVRKKIDFGSLFPCYRICPFLHMFQKVSEKIWLKHSWPSDSKALIPPLYCFHKHIGQLVKQRPLSHWPAIRLIPHLKIPGSDLFSSKGICQITDKGIQKFLPFSPVGRIRAVIIYPLLHATPHLADRQLIWKEIQFHHRLNAVIQIPFQNPVYFFKMILSFTVFVL